MDIRIIENSCSNHLTSVKTLLSACDEAFFASPFISDEAIDLLNTSFHGVKSLTVVTTMKQQDYDQMNKVPVLLKLYEIAESNSVEVVIKIDNRLHGKVYIGKKEGNYDCAIVTSANLTRSGFLEHHEWGVYLNDTITIKRMCEQILSEAGQTIDKACLLKMEEWIKNHPIASMPRIEPEYDLLNLVKAPVEIGKNVTCWLKPYGTRERHVSSSQLFNETEKQITFAKGVGSIVEGDVLVVYAVGGHQIISIYEATGRHGTKTEFKDEHDRRWPHYVVCRNLTPGFGARWSKINLILDTVVSSYLQKNPAKEIRPGSRDFAVMRRGHDRLRLDREFTEYLVRAVMAQTESLDEQ